MKKYEIVEQWIRSQIIENRILPGEKLPSESELCGQFGVSRNVVRQALTNLVHEGWLETVKGVGTFCRSRVSGRELSTNIGFVCFFTGSYIFPEIIRGCDHVLYRKGFHLLLNQSEYDVAKERNILLNLKKKGVDGIIIEPVYSDDNPQASNADVLLEMQMQGVAVVLCDNCYPHQEFSSVCLDDTAGGRLAAAHLWERGHRKIGVFFESDYQVKQARRRGVEGYLREQGRPVPPEWSIGFAGQGSKSGAAEAARRFFAEASELPTAMVCSSDEDALHLIREAESRGLRIPEDLSIVGFDNSKVAQLEKIALTSVEHPSFFLGETATNILLEQIHNPALSLTTKKTISPRIIERSSVRAL